MKFQNPAHRRGNRSAAGDPRLPTPALPPATEYVTITAECVTFAANYFTIAAYCVTFAAENVTIRLRDYSASRIPVITNSKEL